MKSKRHSAILKLIASENIETQEDLASLLSEQGYKVTQATVSRDIKELRLIKVQNGEGRYKYATVERAESDLQDRFISMFSSCVISISSSGNLIVIKTMPGSASVAAEAIDSMRWNEIAGSIAGDNTIFVAIKDDRSVADVARKFQKMMQ